MPEFRCPNCGGSIQYTSYHNTAIPCTQCGCRSFIPQGGQIQQPAHGSQQQADYSQQSAENPHAQADYSQQADAQAQQSPHYSQQQADPYAQNQQYGQQSAYQTNSSVSSASNSKAIFIVLGVLGGGFLLSVIGFFVFAFVAADSVQEDFKEAERIHHEIRTDMQSDFENDRKRMERDFNRRSAEMDRDFSKFKKDSFGEIKLDAESEAKKKRLREMLNNPDVQRKMREAGIDPNSLRP